VTDLPIDVLARAARVVGDRWSMLIVTALAGGGRRYGELADDVPGISTNVLAARLGALADAGLVIGEAYSPRPDRFRYELTAEGRALVDALMALAAWGAEHLGSADEAPAPRHETCGTRLELRWHCPACGVDVEPGDAAGPEVFHA
jgi:DNA-binding HxlR family transcriptional regulator